MSVWVLLADGSIDEYTDHDESDGHRVGYAYRITATGHLAVHQHRRHDRHESAETIQAIYSPTGWQKVTGRDNDQSATQAV